MGTNDSDREYMRIALDLARKGSPSPNPYVGAVVVKDGDIIGKGYHKKAGGPHAEVHALKGIDGRGATLYVTLEPCSHYGKTPPCTDVIVTAGITRVVCALKDPNPLVEGIAVLRSKGIDVDVGIMEKEARKVNEKFIKFMTQKIPFVTVKCAVSLDGKIACNSGDSKWITSEQARKYARTIRGEYDAIVVGISTVLQDDPGLRAETGRDPVRVILDSTLRIPVNAKVFTDSNIIIATTERFDKKKREILEEKASIWVCGTNTVDLPVLMERLGQKGITSVFIEGGSEVNASAVKDRIVDKFLFFVAPKLITGNNAKGPIGGCGIETMDKAISLKEVTVKRIGPDIFVEAYPDW